MRQAWRVALVAWALLVVGILHVSVSNHAPEAPAAPLPNPLEVPQSPNPRPPVASRGETSGSFGPPLEPEQRQPSPIDGRRSMLAPPSPPGFRNKPLGGIDIREQGRSRPRLTLPADDPWRRSMLTPTPLFVPISPFAAAARDTRLAAHIQGLCDRGVCTASPRPGFCANDESAPEPVFNFARNLAAEKAGYADPVTITAIFSLLGERYYGPGGQEYVWEAIRQWRLWHPASVSGIRVIVFDSQLDDPYLVRNATRFGVVLEPVSKLRPHVPEWDKYDEVFYIQGYMHPGGSRETGNKEFNRLVTARFFAMLGLMRRDSLIDVVHLENDMMVYADFRPFVGAFLRCGSPLATMFPAKKGAIPGVMFVRDAEGLSLFTSYVNDLLACGKQFGKKVQKGYANDMTYLKNLFELYGNRAVTDIPNYLVKPGENCIADELNRAWLFDGASFGQWYSFAIAASGSQEVQPTPVHEAVPPKNIAPFAPDYGTSASASTARAAAAGSTTLSVDDGAMALYCEASAEQGLAVTMARPPQHIRDAMRERFLDPTPGTFVKWSFDEGTRLRIPNFGSTRIAALHIHAKNLFWFRSA
jgi:hypothetical protein